MRGMIVLVVVVYTLLSAPCFKKALPPKEIDTNINANTTTTIQSMNEQKDKPILKAKNATIQKENKNQTKDIKTNTTKAEIKKTKEPKLSFRGGYTDRAELKDIIDDYTIIDDKIFNCTSYIVSIEDCGKTDGITASGKHVKAWHTIASSSKYSFGTKIYIPYFKDAPNKGIFVVEDRGGAIKGDKLDIYMVHKSDSLDFGRKKLQGYVIKDKE